MGIDIYTSIGYYVVWILKYIVIPIVVAVLARLIANKLLQPQPQKKKRSPKSRL